MRFVFEWRAPRIVAGGLFLLMASVFATPSIAADPDVPAGVAGKFVGGTDLSRLWAQDGARQRVIVEFAAPQVPDAASFDSPAEADAAQISAVHAAQDAIIAASLGGDLASGQSSELNIRRMDFSPMFAATLSASELESLAANPAVLRIHEDALAAPLLNESGPLIGMPAAYAAGATGNGFHVAVLDTGGRRSHEFLSSRIVSAACFSTTDAGNDSVSICPGGAASSFDINSANDCDLSINGCGHGTHVAGISAGFNTNLQGGEPINGIARDARLISINVFTRFNSTFCNGAAPCALSYQSDQLSGLERVFALRNTLNIAAVNMSLGGGQNAAACDNNALKPIIDQLRAAGIATVIAAGNDGFDTSVSAPGCISTAITVGSSTKQDGRSGFSNWGTLIDVVAPGSQINSSYLSGGSNTFYDSLSGTSMASPTVAGAFAALRSARPNATVDQIEAALESTGLGIASAGTTKPRIRVDQALAALGGGGGNSTIVAAVTPVARATGVGTTVTAFATIINSGNATATACSVAQPAGVPATFQYRSRNFQSGALGPINTPVNIPAGGRQDYLMSFTPTGTLSQNIALVFDCTNTNPAPSVSGLNTFLLTATGGTPPADLISIAVTNTNDGIMNVPLGGTGFAALAAINLGATANIVASLDANPIGGSGGSLQGTVTVCQTNPNTGACLAAPSPTVNTTVNNGQTVTFTAFLASNGTPMAFDPANRRMFVHFRQNGTPVGSASVAVRTTGGGGASLAAASSN